MSDSRFTLDSACNISINLNWSESDSDFSDMMIIVSDLEEHLILNPWSEGR